jgi:hypothetical protein
LVFSQPLSRLLPFDPSIHDTARFIGHYIVVGTLSASVVALSTAPLNLAATHLAADVGRVRYSDVLDVWRRVVSEVGIAVIPLPFKCRKIASSRLEVSVPTKLSEACLAAVPH